LTRSVDRDHGTHAVRKESMSTCRNAAQRRPAANTRLWLISSSILDLLAIRPVTPLDDVRSRLGGRGARHRRKELWVPDRAIEIDH
jgi:hypothetical protein